ncbi:hypothetical protein BDF21DRAFT_466641 [Thamnidium elegans]|nr:hypothetical protein BDF21DRAFT_466641 [Thamnidium elegans]
MVNTLIYESTAKPFGYATIVIYLAVIVYIICIFRKRRWCRSYMGYTAIAAAAASMLNSIFGIVVIDIPKYALPPFNLFFSLSNVCLFLPALIGFQRMSQQKKNEIGQFLAYAGYGWSMTVASTGTTLTALNTSIRFEDYEYLALSISYLNGGFVILLLVYMCITIGHLRGFGRRAFIAFVFCFILQAVAYSLLANMTMPSVLMQTFMLTVFTIPRIICMCTATLHGHTWTLEYVDCDEDDDSLMDNESM